MKTSAGLIGSAGRWSWARWHRIYYLLAAFDVLTVSMSLWVNTRIMSIYRASIEANKAWDELLHDSSELGRSAAAVNAPGNDVFESGDVEAEAEKVRRAWPAFDARHAELRAGLRANAREGQAGPLLRDLDATRAATAAMAREADRIFIHLSRGEQPEAAGRMATMDREFAGVNASLDSLRAHIAAIQRDRFGEQMAAAARLQRSQSVLAVLILVMVVGATGYGLKIAGQVKSIARELEMRVERRTDELMRANEALRAEIAERRRAEEAIREGEDRYRDLIESTHDLVQSIAPDGRIELVNRAWLETLGYTEAELPGLNLFEIIDPDSRPHCQDSFSRVLAGESVSNLEATFVAKDGRRIEVEGNATGRYRHNQLIATQGFFRDITERKRAAEVRARLLGQVLSAQEDERRRIARDLHDEIGQSLMSLLIGLRNLEHSPAPDGAWMRVGDLERITVSTIDEVRRLARGLRPSVLDDLGLAAALGRYAADYERGHGIPVAVEATDRSTDRLPEAVETALYRIVQEALTNTAKHARAKAARIVIQRRPSSVQVTVADDGCGFDEGDAGSGGQFGLSGMRERAALLGGSLTFESGPGRGTRVVARIPLGEVNDGEDPRTHGR
jgi:PAS domain S-box-containing protein